MRNFFEIYQQENFEIGVASILMLGSGEKIEFWPGWFEPYFRFGVGSQTDVGGYNGKTILWRDRAFLSILKNQKSLIS